jgi:hypothetical protein
VADHLHRALGSLRCRDRGAREDCAGGVLRVCGIGLAAPAAYSAVGPVDLDHPVPVLAQVAGESGAVGTGALDAEAKDLSELGSPLGELFVSTAVGGDAEVALDAADDVDNDRGVHVLVGVVSDDDFPDRPSLQDAGHGRAGGQDCDERLVEQAPIGSLPAWPAARIEPAAAVTDRSTARTPERSVVQRSSHHCGGDPILTAET